MELELGCRIELVSMPEDPDPMPVGSQGTVVSITRLPWFGTPTTQIGVDWDNSKRKLMLSVPPDSYRILSVEEQEQSVDS